MLVYYTALLIALCRKKQNGVSAVFMQLSPVWGVHYRLFQVVRLVQIKNILKIYR